MKCKECGNEINLNVFGSPDDICWDCLNKSDKDNILNTNIGIAPKKTTIKYPKSLKNIYKISEINMNIKEKSQVVMLSTNQKAKVNNEYIIDQFELYFLSDEEIKEGDKMIVGAWYINTYRGYSKPFQNYNLDNNGYCKEVIAATDKSLFESIELTDNEGKFLDKVYLPNPSSEFVQKFIDEYNKGNKIEWVDKDTMNNIIKYN